MLERLFRTQPAVKLQITKGFAIGFNREETALKDLANIHQVTRSTHTVQVIFLCYIKRASRRFNVAL